MGRLVELAENQHNFIFFTFFSENSSFGFFWHFSVLTFSGAFSFRHFPVWILLIFSVSDTFQFWIFLTLSSFEFFWHFRFWLFLTLSVSDSFSFWRFQFLALSVSDTFSFWHFQFLTLSVSDTFSFWHFLKKWVSDTSSLWLPEFLLQAMFFNLCFIKFVQNFEFNPPKRLVLTKKLTFFQLSEMSEPW